MSSAHDAGPPRAEAGAGARRARGAAQWHRGDHALAWARFAVALAVTLGVMAAAWVARPEQLSQPDDIVGYPAYHDFNFAPMFLAHRLVVWVLPLLTAVLYCALRRWGPLRERAGGREDRPARRLIVRPGDAAADVASPRWTAALSVLPTALVIALAASASSEAALPTLGARGLLAGSAFLLVVRLLGLLVGRLVDEDGDALVALVATPVGSLAGLWWFARSAAVYDEAGAHQDWPWLPVWIPAALALTAVAWAACRLRAGDAPGQVASRLASVAAGGVLVFLTSTRMPGAVPRFQGFDDAHAVTGADLLTRGYFPWRDVLFLHGVFEDALRANVGFWLFEHSIWGALAASIALWVPLYWVGAYLLLVWTVPRHWLLHVAAVATVTWASALLPVSVRWFALGYVLILLGTALRRDSVTRTAAMTAGLFVAAVLIPEMSFLVLAVVAVLVVHDLTRRGENVRWWRRLRRLRDFVLTGTALACLWAVFLAANGALGAWIAYYLYYGPGHNETGAQPWNLYDNGTGDALYLLSEALVIVGLAWLLALLIGRRPFRAEHGVALAAALTTGLYAEKALGKYDYGHILQVVTVAVPYWFVLATCAVVATTRALRRRGRPTAFDALPRLPAVGVVAATAALIPLMVHLPTSGTILSRAAWNSRAEVPSLTDAPDLIGYSEPGPEGTDTTMVSDLASIIDTLAPGDETVYDFTNSPGYFTYLMQERLASRLYTVGIALSEASMRELVGDLEADPPAVVVFDDLNYGLPTWDGLRNEVRHYTVSPYLLDGWTPVLETYGFLIMVRDDLLTSLPVLPEISAPVVRDDLYFSMPTCSWGHLPDFLAPATVESEVTVPVGAFREQRRFRVSGWSYDVATGAEPRRLLAATGARVLATGRASLERPDVNDVLGAPQGARTGFAISGLTRRTGQITTYAVLDDGLAHPVGPPRGEQPETLILPSGAEVVTSPIPAAGNLDDLSAEHVRVAKVDLPPGTDLGKYGQVTLSSRRGPVGPATVTVFDDPAPAGLSRDISFATLPGTGHDVSVRVGACLQWHGYSGDTLYLAQDGGHRIDELRLGVVPAEQ